MLKLQNPIPPLNSICSKLTHKYVNEHLDGHIDNVNENKLLK